MTKLTFLGTGTSQGVPMISCHCRVCSSQDPYDHRLRSSVLVETDDRTLLIDCGPDFRQQMLREHIDKVDAILFTHNHKDHIAGLDDVRAFNYTLQRPMDVYAEEYVLQTIKKEFSYAFSEKKYPGVPEIILHAIDETPFGIGNTKIIPIRGHHLMLPVLGFRIGNLCYITDMNRIEEQEVEKFKGVDILVINALRREKHLSHFCLDEALQVIEKAAPKRTYLTHISHQMGRYAEIKDELADRNVYFAYDGLKLETDDK